MKLLKPVPLHLVEIGKRIKAGEKVVLTPEEINDVVEYQTYALGELLRLGSSFSPDETPTLEDTQQRIDLVDKEDYAEMRQAVTFLKDIVKLLFPMFQLNFMLKDAGIDPLAHAQAHHG